MRRFARSLGQRWRHLAASALLCVGAAAHGTAPPREAAPELPPAEVRAALPGARLLGEATMRFLGLRVYDARLWVSDGFDAQRFETQPFALELRYARSFGGDAIAQRSLDEMRRHGPIDDAQAQAWQAGMKLAFPNVASGDRLIGVHAPAGRARFFHNGRPTHEIDGRGFARLFFGIWLAPTTSEPALRRQLLAVAP